MVSFHDVIQEIGVVLETAPILLSHIIIAWKDKSNYVATGSWVSHYLIKARDGKNMYIYSLRERNFKISTAARHKQKIL